MGVWGRDVQGGSTGRAHRQGGWCKSGQQGKWGRDMQGARQEHINSILWGVLQMTPEAFMASMPPPVPPCVHPHLFRCLLYACSWACCTLRQCPEGVIRANQPSKTK